MNFPAVARCRFSQGRRRASRWGSLLIAAAALLLLAADDGEKPRRGKLPLTKKSPALDADALAQDAEPRVEAPTEEPVAQGANPKADARTAYLVTAPLPISGSVDTQIKRRIHQVLESLPETGERPILVIEFQAAAGDAGEGSEFERAFSLARYLSSPELSKVRTVAFLPQSVRGHAVLPILACEEIVMGPEAELGPAGQGEEFVDSTLAGAYSDIAKRRQVIPPAMALAMLDRKLKVVKVETTSGDRYVVEADLAKIPQADIIAIETISPSGEIASFSASELRVKYGWVSHLAEDQRRLALELQLDPNALRSDLSLGGDWKAVQIKLKGPVQGADMRWMQQSLEKLIAAKDANFVLVWIDSPGGSLEDSMQLANFLADFNPSEVRTVAYVPEEALADATLVALACDMLVMGPRARLGGPGELQWSERDRVNFRLAVRSLAESKSRDWSMLAALVDPEQTLHQYVHRTTRARRFLTEEEYEADPQRDRWTKGREVNTQNGLSGEQAVEMGLARHLAENYGEFKILNQLEQDPTTMEPNWVYGFVESLSQQWIARLLLFIGISCLLTELSQPGLSAPGFISFVCFLLFFWSQFLHGTADALEILLFVAGLICLILEMFVVPGVGVFGVGGLFMMVLSIVLVSQTFVIPQNSYQLEQLAQSVTIAMAGMAGAGVTLYAIRRFLPHLPFFSHLMLKPAEGEELAERNRREEYISWEHLLGKRGVTVSRLAPSGKAQFGDDVISVISDSELIPAGVAVTVMEVSGSRVLVAPVETASG
ncbi:NfeD family protein [Lignipirellula cremea]|nr:NfeD family protein [Lignipirellula cremea]